MKIIKKQYTHYVSDNVQVDLNAREKYNVYVVYFINGLVNLNYLDWLYNQLPLVDYNCTIYIVACINKGQEKFLKKSTAMLFPNLNIHIECYFTNEYEYRGILKVWDLAQKHNKRNDIILYFHSKGVTRHSDYTMNKQDDYNIILTDIDKIKEIFTIFPTIDKVGFSCSELGWLWYNFWFVRGSYAYMLEKPIKTERRHYYEDWLIRKVEHESDKKSHKNKERPFSFYKKDIQSCYGFHTDRKTILNIGSWFDSETKTYKLI
jgi:hypothetical protein